jgi:pantetheine-phosphate adenylyltransferase
MNQYGPEFHLHQALLNLGFYDAWVVQNDLELCWDERQRHFHTQEHMEDVISRVVSEVERQGLTTMQRSVLVVAAGFHDAVYDPTASDNEEKSCQLLREQYKKFGTRTTEETDKGIDYVARLIMATKSHEPFDGMSKILLDADMATVSERRSLTELLRYEHQIFREYQFVDYPVYAASRVNLLLKWAETYPSNREGLRALADYVQHRRPRVGIYAGSFNPFHAGHRNIVHKAEEMVDKVIVAQGYNPAKAPSSHDLNSVLSIKYHQKETFSGLLTAYVKEKAKSTDPILIRGLRNGDDLAYEVNQLRVLQDFMPNLKVAFIHCDREFEHVSSTVLRQLEVLSKTDQSANQVAFKYRA